ncbi:MAG: 1,5-anhydro-D-fructose reductase [Deltaproteobacteria bacterium ADurb.Bin207]|nr:MAG: 1,5-anhydro-D-fructose reductase [Deltaproteobacteria bacterium ADurb.Bin207]
MPPAGTISPCAAGSYPPRYFVALDSTPIRVAHLGCGVWGRNLIRELQAHPDVALTWLVDTDASALDQALALAPQAIPCSSLHWLDPHHVDAVVIATPGPWHTQHALTALQAGLDVFVEKPMATQATDARKLAAAFHATDRIGMVGHLMHHHGAIHSLFEAIRQGRIGTPLAFHSARLCRPNSRDVDGSLLFSLAPHDISLLRALDASAIRHIDTKWGRMGSLLPNIANLHLRLSSGLEAHIVVSRAHHTKVRKTTIVGEHASIVFDDVTSGPKLTLRHHGKSEALDFDPTPPLRTEIREFIHCIRTRKNPTIGTREGLEVVEILERAQAIAMRHDDRNVTRKSSSPSFPWKDFAL